MENWFTVEKIDDDTFTISEYGHWEETHCYLLLGTARALLIDTGLGISNIGKIVSSLTSLPVTVATTHVHWDHIGGHRYFEDISVHEAEKAWLSGSFPIPLSVVKANLMKVPCSFPADFDPEQYSVFQGQPQHVFSDGYVFDLGGRQITTIHTPGHSPGHCCFYEQRGFLYSGDLLYKGCLDAFYPTTDPNLFWKSLQKIQAYPAERILPAHHDLELPADLLHRTEQAFSRLHGQGLLKQGAGLFDFGDFQIHI